MRFSTSKQQPKESTTTSTIIPDISPLLEELGGHERTIARLGPEDSLLANRISNLRDDRARIVGGHVYEDDVHSEGRRRMAVIDVELATRKQRRAEIAPTVQASINRVSEIRAILASGVRLSAERAVEKAASEAPSREKYIAAKQKLQQIREKLEASEVDFEKARTATQMRSDRASRAEAILELGLMPRTVSASTPEELSRAAEEISVFRQAVELQRVAVINMRAEFAEEIRKALVPTCTTLIQRIASSYREAEAATLEGYEIQEAVRREADGRGIGEFLFPGVQPPLPGNYSEFECWITEKRKEGVEV